jgi:hypothetical protein
VYITNAEKVTTRTADRERIPRANAARPATSPNPHGARKVARM